MYKVEVSVPAAVTSLGPGLDTLGLALSLHVYIEMTVRQDGELDVRVTGENADDIPADFYNPVLRAATWMFQQKEMAPAGLSISIENQIPLNIGLDAEAAMLIGGLVAANNLTDGRSEREDIIEAAVALGMTHVDALTTLLGGLNVSVLDDDGAHLYRSLEPPPLQTIVMVPEIPEYAAETEDALPDSVPLDAAIFNMGRLLFMVEALVDGDFALLRRTMQDRLFQQAFTDHIPGYAAAVRAAEEAGAAAVTLASQGPTMLIFAPYNHALIAHAMRDAFRAAGVPNCRWWTVGIDAQGVTVSVAS